MINIDNEYILSEITNQFGEKVISSYQPYGLLTIEFDKNSIKINRIFFMPNTFTYLTNSTNFYFLNNLMN